MVFKDQRGKYHIYDWKRTKKIDPDGNFGKFGRGLARDVPDCNYWHYTLQLNLYKHILESKYGMKIDRMYLMEFYPGKKLKRQELPVKQPRPGSRWSGKGATQQHATGDGHGGWEQQALVRPAWRAPVPATAAGLS